MKPNPDADPPKLRMAPADTPEQLAKRFERERRTQHYAIEEDLSHSLAPYRVGSVRYLNAVPLTRGIEDQVTFATPAELARLLRENRLDAALVSVTEAILTDRYDILDGIAVASLGEVVSVFLAHRGPLAEAREIHCDPASLTSVNLLKVLLAERGIHPRFTTLESYAPESLPDYTLLIGDPAIDFLRAPHDHEIWDLGSAWHEVTGLPFVYAVWALRRGLDTGPLAARLREARNFGLDTLDAIVRDRTDYDPEFRRDYLGWHIHYHLGKEERAGLARFMELLDQHGLGPTFPPRFVG